MAGQKKDRALVDSSGSNQSQPPGRPSNPSWPVSLLRKIQGQLEKRRAKQKQEAPADRAAKSTARATWAIAALTLAAIAVGVSQYVIFNRQLDEMRRTREGGDESMAAQIRIMQDQAKAMQTQAEVSRQALLASDRPWLQVAGFNVERLQTDQQNVYTWTDLKLRNVGHSPALDIHIAPVLMPSLSVTEEAAEVVRICREAKTRSYSFYNSVVFPGEDRTYFPNETLFDLDIASIQRRKEAKVKDQRVQQRDMLGDGPAEAEAQRVMDLPLRDGLTLLGCVTYKSATGGDVHATSFGLDLLRSCPEGPIKMCAFEFSQPAILPHDELTERPLLGASYAD